MYREVTMLEVKEVLRRWREGVPCRGNRADHPPGCARGQRKEDDGDVNQRSPVLRSCAASRTSSSAGSAAVCVTASSSISRTSRNLP